MVLRAHPLGTPADRAAALAALKDARSGRLVELARGALPAASLPLAASLREVLATRGLAAP